MTRAPHKRIPCTVQTKHSVVEDAEACQPVPVPQCTTAEPQTDNAIGLPDI